MATRAQVGCEDLLIYSYGSLTKRIERAAKLRNGVALIVEASWADKISYVQWTQLVWSCGRSACTMTDCCLWASSAVVAQPPPPPWYFLQSSPQKLTELPSLFNQSGSRATDNFILNLLLSAFFFKKKKITLGV
jgi:hypothetical protein